MKIGLGTSSIGRPVYINIRTDKNAAIIANKKEFKTNSLAVLDFAYQNGIRTFDTSPSYGFAEEILLEWVNSRELADIEIFSKWGYLYKANFDPNASQHEEKIHSPEMLREQWESTKLLLPQLKRYQIHSATLESGVLDNAEVISKLIEIKNEHNIQIGITVTGNNQNEIIQKVLEIDEKNGGLFDSFQVSFNLFEQSLLEIEKLLIGKQLIIKEALANGRVFPNQDYSHYNRTYQILSNLSKKYNVGIDAIALRFCIATFPNAIILSGAGNTKQLEENLKANTFNLSTVELEELRCCKVEPLFYWNERKNLSWN